MKVYRVIWACLSVIACSHQAQALPDLTVTDIQLGGAPGNIADARVIASFENIGIPSMPPATPRFHILLDGVLCEDGEVLGIDAGGAVQVESTSCNPAQAGEYQIQVTIDPEESVVESNENNNSLAEFLNWRDELFDDGFEGEVPAIEDVIRFVALGDAGEGNATQITVGAAMESICSDLGGCDFALYLGDNFYDVGVQSTADSQFADKFETPYAALDFPFHAVLGQVDYGGTAALDLTKAQAQIDYTALSQKWSMPDFYYSFTEVNAGVAADFFALDTFAVQITEDTDQKAWLSGAITAASSPWKIVFGHHTYISNGSHGNAGSYEGLSGAPAILSGEHIKTLVDEVVCGEADIYIAAHDHNRQWLQPQCGTEFVVVGTGAKTTDLVGRGVSTFFETDMDGGFIVIEVYESRLTGSFYNQSGALEFTRTLTK